MKRMWTYLGALLPLSLIEARAEEIAPQAVETTEPAQRAKKADGEAENSHADGNAAAQDSSAAPPKGAPPVDQSATSAGEASMGGGHAVKAKESTVPHDKEAFEITDVDGSNGGMYAPAKGSGVTPTLLQAGGSVVVGGPASASGPASAGDTIDPQTTTPPVTGATPPIDDTTVSTDTVADPAAPGPASQPEEKLDDADSMIVMLGGRAVAGGNGETTGDIDLDIIDYGNFTVAIGVATFEAYSSGPGAEDGYADTFVDVSGADLVFTHEFNFDHAYGEGPYATFIDISQTYVVAIDFEAGAEAADAENVLSPHDTFGPFASLPPELIAMLDTEGDDHSSVSIDGNAADLSLAFVGGIDQQSINTSATTTAIEESSSLVALDGSWQGGALTIDTQAQGFDTIASADATAIALQDGYSVLDAYVIAGA